MFQWIELRAHFKIPRQLSTMINTLKVSDSIKAET